MDLEVRSFCQLLFTRSRMNNATFFMGFKWKYSTSVNAHFPKIMPSFGLFGTLEYLHYIFK